MSDDDDKNDKHKGKELVKLLATLTPREAKVLRQRFGLDLENDPDLEELGKLFDVTCLLYTSPSPRDQRGSRMPSSA